MSKFLSPGKAAESLGVHPATVRRWVDEGRLPGAVHTAGGHVRIPPEDIERLRGNSGCGKALLYLRVGEESERKYLDAGLAHLTRYATERDYSVTRVVSEVGPGIDGDRPKLAEIRQEIQHGAPGYEAIIVERPDRLLLTGGRRVYPVGRSGNSSRGGRGKLPGSGRGIPVRVAGGLVLPAGRCADHVRCSAGQD